MPGHWFELCYPLLTTSNPKTPRPPRCPTTNFVGLDVAEREAMTRLLLRYPLLTPGRACPA